MVLLLSVYSLPHVQPAGDQLPEALLVSKGVTRAQRPGAAANRRLPPRDRVFGLRFGLVEPLTHADFVGEGWSDVGGEETKGDNGYDENDASEKEAEPEGSRGKDCVGCPHVDIAHLVVVKHQ